MSIAFRKSILHIIKLNLIMNVMTVKSSCYLHIYSKQLFIYIYISISLSLSLSIYIYIYIS